jgi:hypothetical protein
MSPAPLDQSGAESELFDFLSAHVCAVRIGASNLSDILVFSDLERLQGERLPATADFHDSTQDINDLTQKMQRVWREEDKRWSCSGSMAQGFPQSS